MSQPEANLQDARAAERMRARNTWVIVELRRGEHGQNVSRLLTFPAHRVPGLVLQPVAGMPHGMTVTEIPSGLAALFDRIRRATWCRRPKPTAVTIRCVAADDPAYADEFVDGHLGYDGVRAYRELASSYWRRIIRDALDMTPIGVRPS